MQVKQSKLRSYLLSSSLAAILAIFSQVFIPLPSTPIAITLQTLALMICAIIQSPREIAITVSLYLLLGAIGLPVFSGFRGGFSHLIGPTGGYLLAFLPASILLSYGLTLGKKSNVFLLLARALGFHAMVYFFGSLWFMKLTNNSLPQTLLLCVVPFLLGDGLKSIVLCPPILCWLSLEIENKESGENSPLSLFFSHGADDGAC